MKKTQNGEFLGANNNQESLRIAGVSERDIDLLLLEEFIASPGFSLWFLKQCRPRIENLGVVKVTGAQRSATQSIGESDLLVVLLGNAGATHYLLIENKIGASFQPRQAARYHERGREYQKKGLCKSYSAVLVAPSAYLGAKASLRGFHALLSYEDLLSWFEENKHLAARAKYKHALLTSAIKKAKYGYDPVEDAPVTDFWQAYWRLALEVAPELEMSEPTSKPSRAGFIYFRPGTLPRGVAIVHKLRHGNLDLQLAGLGRQLSRVRAEFGPALTRKMHIERAAESAVIRQKVPIFDTGRPFSEQADMARECLERARTLLQWYHNVKRKVPH